MNLDTETFVTNLFLVLYVLEVLIAALWAFPGIIRYWREEEGRTSPLWTALVVMSGLAVSGAILTLPVAAVALFDLPRLPLTGIAITLVVMLELGAVIVYRIVFDRIRKNGHSIVREEPASEEEEQ
jgi:preprotein translocase subunit Sec61beta